MALNIGQTNSLSRLRAKFVAERSAIAEIEPGTLHARLDLLTIDDLRYLEGFPRVARGAIVDMDATDEQAAADESPVFDLAQASKKAGQAIELLEAKFAKAYKAFDDEMKSGFRLESVWESPKYKTIARSVGLDLGAATLRFLAAFDPREAAKGIKGEIIGQFGFDELAKMYEPGGPAIRIDRLLEESKDMPGGPNPVLFEAVAAEIVDDYSAAYCGERGFVKGGNVRIKLVGPARLGNGAIAQGEMAAIEMGVNPKKFSLSPDAEDYFPSVPASTVRPIAFDRAEVVDTVRKKMESRSLKGLDFLVEADVSRQTATYRAGFGKVLRGSFGG